MRISGRLRTYRRGSLFATFGTTLAVVATLVGVAPTSSPASADERPSLRALLDECNTGAGISGVATAADGTPIVDAPVTVFAEHDGPGKATLPVLARDRTDAAGCYQLDVPANRQLLDAADRFGLVNMHLIIQNGRQLQSVNVPRDLLVRAGGRVQLLEVGTQAGTAAYRPGRATLGLPTTGSAHQSFGPQAAAARADAARGRSSLRLGGHTGVDPDAVAATERAVGAAPDQV
ncbi:MAG TPA: hypothetical protein VNP92_00920, partial [Actinophytocola sp.]|nr:hypothetical protein [Actinophytocola sp.]